MVSKTKIIALISILTVLIGFFLLWHITPLAQYTEARSLIQQIKELQEVPGLPFIIILAYLVAGLTLFPMTILNIALVIVFGPWIGFCYAYLGNVLSALLTFSIIRIFGHKPFHHLSGQKIRHISQLIAQRGVVSVVFLRITPISFAILSMIAGISHIRFKDYFLGSLIGVVPGIAIVCFFAGKIRQILSQPTLEDILILLVGGICIILLWNWLYRRLKKTAVNEQNIFD